MNTRVMNPDSMMMQQMEGHWQQMVAIILWKLVKREVVKITAADMEALQAEFGCLGPVVFTHGKADAIEFSLITQAQAQVLAEHDRRMRGQA